MLKELFEPVLRSLVEHPDQIDVKETITPTVLILEVRAHKDDLGKILGKNKRTIQALRTLVHAAGRNGGHQRGLLEIIESDQP